jgi:hypothetical protein
MNLEYDDEEQSLLSQFEQIVADIGAGRLQQRSGPDDSWSRLVSAGWSELGSEIERGALPLGLAVGIFRCAGRQLLVEQFLSSAYLLSALMAHAKSEVPGQRAQEALRARPGVLLGDSRDKAVPVVAARAAEGYCFGASSNVDVYSLTRSDQGRYTLLRWRAARPSVEFLPKSALSTARVRISPATDGWDRCELDLTDQDLDRISTSALLLHSAALLGCAQRLLEVTVEFVKTRHQFGVPVGSFQAVKHGLADVATATTVSWNAILTASARGADPVIAPLVARYLTVDAALLSARSGAQFHGGIGFTAELNVHLFLRTILEGAQRFGSHDDFATAIGRAAVEKTC